MILGIAGRRGDLSQCLQRSRTQSQQVIERRCSLQGRIRLWKCREGRIAAMPQKQPPKSFERRGSPSTQSVLFAAQLAAQFLRNRDRRGRTIESSLPLEAESPEHVLVGQL